MGSPPPSRRWLGVAAAAAAIALILLGDLSRDWLRGIDHGIESRLGLREIELCQMVEPVPGDAVQSCETVPLAAIAGSRFAPEGFDRFRTLATATHWAGVAAIALLAIALALGVANRAVDLFVHPTTLAILASATALVLGGLVLALNPYSGLVGWGSGRGFVFYGVGAGLGVFGAILLGQSRALPPSEFDP